MTTRDISSSDVIDTVVSKLSRMYGTPDFSSFSSTYTVRFNRPYHCPFCGYDTVRSVDVTIDNKMRIVGRVRSPIDHDKTDCWARKMREKYGIKNREAGSMWDGIGHSLIVKTRELIAPLVCCIGCKHVKNELLFRRWSCSLYCCRSRVPIPVGKRNYCDHHELRTSVRDEFCEAVTYITNIPTLRLLTANVLKAQELREKHRQEMDARIRELQKQKEEREEDIKRGIGGMRTDAI